MLLAEALTLRGAPSEAIRLERDGGERDWTGCRGSRGSRRLRGFRSGVHRAARSDGDQGRRRPRGVGHGVGVPRRRVPGHCQPEPLAPGAAHRQARPVRGDRRDLPGPRVRDVEHDAGRGRPRRHRDRSVDLRRGRRRRDRPVPGAPWRPRGDGGHLHPRPPRPLRRGARRGRRRHRRADRRAEHFLEHAVSENVYAGTAMLRRVDVLRRHQPRQGPDRDPRHRARRRRLDRHAGPDRARPSTSPIPGRRRSSTASGSCSR